MDQFGSTTSRGDKEVVDWLTASTDSLGNDHFYSYDSADNLTGIDTPHVDASVVPNVLNQAATVNGAAYQYDANGNLVDDGAKFYRWDAENRLVGIVDHSAPTSALASSFRYDGAGRMLAIVDSENSVNKETRYLWCGDRICQSRDATDAVTALFHEEGVYRPSATPPRLLYARDHLGSVRSLISAQGVGRGYAFYDPYGYSPDDTVMRQQPFGYAGMFYHVASGLYLTRYRAYDPRLGRWLSRDPIEEEGGVNLYSYVEGNPVSYVDPTGEIAFIPIVIGIGAGYAFDYLLEQYKKEHCTCKDTPAGTAGNAAAGGAVGGTGPFTSKPRGGIAGGGPSGTATSSFSQMNHAAASRGWYSVSTRNWITKNILRRVPYAGAALAAYEVYDTISCD